MDEFVLFLYMKMGLETENFDYEQTDFWVYILASSIVIQNQLIRRPPPFPKIRRLKVT